MDRIKRQLERLTGEALACADPDSDVGKRLAGELKLMQELARVHALFEKGSPEDGRIRGKLDALTAEILKGTSPVEAQRYLGELEMIQSLTKMWMSSAGIEIRDEQWDRDRRSSLTWDTGGNSLRTPIKLTMKQREALRMLDSGLYDKFLALGGSGSGKSHMLVYKVIRDALRYKAPCLIARDKLIDLRAGVIDQIVPRILQQIAAANEVDRWETWVIDGLKFAKWTDKKTVIEFATGGYVRFAGLSARDLSESGADKILSPSWFHIMLEEVSELDYETVEKVMTRLRYTRSDIIKQKRVLMMCENPPSINHWSYKRFFEQKREDGSKIGLDEQAGMFACLMNPKDNLENLGDDYIKTLSQLSGANYERFYLGQFQDTEQGEVLKRMNWTDNLPRKTDWDKLIVYVDPTPLTGKEFSKFADYKASVLLGICAGETYVLDIRIVRGSTMDMLQNIKQLYDASPNKSITEVVMEDKQVPSDFKQVLATFTATTNWVVPIKRDKRMWHGDKAANIETFLQPLVENDMIWFNEKWRDTDRGKEAQVQWLKFSRKSNKFIHDDIPDAIMRGDTYMKGRASKKRYKPSDVPTVQLVRPGFIHGIPLAPTLASVRNVN